MTTTNKILANKCFIAMQPKAVYSSKQVYAIEKRWFAQGNNSFALMQQAAWQMAQHILQVFYHNKYRKIFAHNQHTGFEPAVQLDGALSAMVWVGAGNNGGDGWLLAYYLYQAGWRVTVIDVGQIQIEKDDEADKPLSNTAVTDTTRAKTMVLKNMVLKNMVLKNIATNDTHVSEDDCFCVVDFDTSFTANNQPKLTTKLYDVFIDALFGIGLDRPPAGKYAQAIHQFNQLAGLQRALAISVDVPSGLVASTGQVFDNCAIKADVTLCLVAPKIGLYIKDGLDFSGKVVDFPLIPTAMNDVVNDKDTEDKESICPTAWQLKSATPMPTRWQNSHKGTYGHVLVIGGRQSAGSQGMGGAAMMAAGSALVSGAGKLTVACDVLFHGAVLSSQPNAMVVDVSHKQSVNELIKTADVVAIGMGLGRDKQALCLFKTYLQVAINAQKPMVIDADGLYHLASIWHASTPNSDGDCNGVCNVGSDNDNKALLADLKKHAKAHQVCFTPHSGEMARLLNTEVKNIEQDRIRAIKTCATHFGGQWLLKGAGSIVCVDGKCFICSVGNAKMATAGMGDVLSGLTAGLMAQKNLPAIHRSLYQAVLIHGMAGDRLKHTSIQAQDMLQAIGEVITQLTG